MRLLKTLFVLFLFLLQMVQAQNKKTLIEVFTNSHCSVCPNAHNALHNYISAPGNAEKVNFLYYHMSYPYSDDPLNLENKTDPAGRSSYYGNFFSTPVVFFNGKLQQNVYTNWPGILDSQSLFPAPLGIAISGNRMDSQYTVSAVITKTGNLASNGLRIHFVLTENVAYTGRNGITRHDFVVRKMLTSPQGRTINLESSPITEQQVFVKQNNWNSDSLSICVFIQDTVTKQILQSQSMPLRNSTTANSSAEDLNRADFILHQNYPNPFNPGTTLSFQLAKDSHVQLQLYSTAGQLVEVLADGLYKQGSHEKYVNFSHLPSGLYFLRLAADGKSITKKMCLLK